MATNRNKTFDVFVGNLPSESNEKNVGKLFIPFGEIGGIMVKESNKAKGPNNKYAFVKFLCEPDADRAIKELDKKKIQGSDICISVKKANDGQDNRKKFQNENLGKKRSGASDTDSNDGNIVTGGVFQGGGAGADGESEMAMVTFVESPVTMWLQVVNDENTKRLFNITEQLASLCPAGKHVMGLPEPGKVYGCLFAEDSMWYRCQVKQSLGTDRYKIQYVDYGNTEEVSVGSLVEIPPSLGNIWALANKIVLHNTRAKDLADKQGVQYLKSLTDNQMTQLIKTRPLADGSGFYGMMFVNGQSVSDAVVQAGYGHSRSAFGKTGPPNKSMANEGGDAPGPQMMGTSLYSNNTVQMPNMSHPPPQLGAANQMNFNNQGGNQDSKEKKLQKELSKKNRELEKAHNDKDTANLQLEYMRSKVKTLQDEYAASAAKLQEDTLSKRITTLMSLAAMVRHLREQFPTNEKQTCLLEEAITLCTSSDRVENSSCSALGDVGSALARYKAAQDEISKCKDQTEISELVESRDDARRELHTMLSMCLDELQKLPIESRSKLVDEFNNRLTTTYSDYLKFQISECPSLENLIPSFRAWKAKKDTEFTDVRMATDFCEEALQTAFAQVKQRISVDTAEVSDKPEVDIDDLMKTYAHALQREISVTDQSHSKDSSLVATVVLSVMRELQQEASSLENFRLLYHEFQNRKQVIEPWLDNKPEFTDMQENRKLLRSLKSKLRHTLADKIDLEESGSKDELAAIQEDVEKLRVELQATLVTSDGLMGNVASLADSNFPELTVQYPDLGIDNYLLYKGLVKSNREIDHYNVSESLRPNVHVSQFNGETVLIQEFHIGDSEHCSKEDFLKQIVQYNSDKGHIQAIFFTKNERQAYVQSSWEDSEPIESVKLSPSELQDVSRQLLQQVAALHSRGIVHGEITPVNVFCRKDNVIYLMYPDFSKSLKERVSKRYVTDKGLVFQYPDIQYSSLESISAAVDVYNLVLLLFMLHVPDGNLLGTRKPGVRLDPSLQKVFEGFMSGQRTSRVTAENLLQLDYFKRTVVDKPSSPVMVQPSPASSPAPPPLENVPVVPVIKSTQEPMEIGVFRAEDYIVTPDMDTAAGSTNFDTDDSWTTKSSSSVSSRVESPLESALEVKSEASNAESLQTVIETDCNSGDTAVYSGNSSEVGEAVLHSADSESHGVKLASEAIIAVKQIQIERNEESEEAVEAVDHTEVEKEPNEVPAIDSTSTSISDSKAEEEDNSC